jgi:hypothetical protein
MDAIVPQAVQPAAKSLKARFVIDWISLNLCRRLDSLRHGRRRWLDQ